MDKLFFFFFLVSLLACRSSQNIPASPLLSMETEMLDTLVVRAERVTSLREPEEKYKPSATRKIDLLHTRLEIGFDMNQRQVIGQALLDLSPFFYPVNSVELDAVGFSIRSVTLKSTDEDKVLSFDYTGRHLIVRLDRTYSREEKIRLSIEYIAHPESSGTNRPFAIGSDQGLFFIDPEGTDPGKPTQVWTQGETSYNSRWFPTVDEPNERCTSDIFVTVDDKYVTLSNGILLASSKNPDGSRTDHWHMDLPHAPYLFSLVVGEYAVVREQWKDIELAYYVFPEFEEQARAIFDHTPDMLGFFSEITGMEYPWQKYSQVIVSDFVSGAMENTTAVTFAEVFQKSREDLVDHPNDLIVAHEMFHHWCGNLLTCESWANLTLNEGFANYAEYLWTEYYNGWEEAEMHRFNEQNQYISSSRFNSHPLVYFEYEDADGMFDAHSYNKGGLVLHMLRKYLGDQAFFYGLRHYLNKHAFSSVEAHDLRIAFEEITGEDLNWFFNQWFYEPGHPLITAKYTFEEGVLRLEIEQKQSSEGWPEVFIFPLSYDLIYPDGKTDRRIVWIDQQKTEIEIESALAPALVVFNSNKDILCTVDIEYTDEQLFLMFKYSKHPVFRYLALQMIRFQSLEEDVLLRALDDPLAGIRRLGLDRLARPLSRIGLKRIRELAVSDPSPSVRLKAIRLMAEDHSGSHSTLFREILQRDSSAMVISACLEKLYQAEDPAVLLFAENWQQSLSPVIRNSVARIFAESGNPDYLPFFRQHLSGGNVFKIVPILYSYEKLVSHLGHQVILREYGWLREELKRMELSAYARNIYSASFEYQLNQLNLTESREDLSEEERHEVRNAIRLFETYMAD